MSFELRPAAEADLAAIAEHIAADNPRAARAWLEDIHMRCRRLGSTPGMGVSRDDARPGLRMFPVGNYLILYRALGAERIEIVRVLHGARMWMQLL